MSEPATVVIEIGDDEMSGIDLPPNVAQQILMESAGNIQASNQAGRDMLTMASSSLKAGVAKAHNELGPVESRAVSGVMATPIASPTTQAGP